MFWARWNSLGKNFCTAPNKSMISNWSAPVWPSVFILHRMEFPRCFSLRRRSLSGQFSPSLRQMSACSHADMGMLCIACRQVVTSSYHQGEAQAFDIPSPHLPHPPLTFQQIMPMGKRGLNQTLWSLLFPTQPSNSAAKFCTQEMKAHNTRKLVQPGVSHGRTNNKVSLPLTPRPSMIDASLSRLMTFYGIIAGNPITRLAS